MTEFYVSPDGSDDWSGSLPQPNEDGTDGPLATLLAARDTARKVRAEGKVGRSSEIKVMLRQGKYFMEETLILTPDDGGSRDCPVTYCAYPGETPTISGGVKLEGWQPHEGEILKHELAGSKGGKVEVPAAVLQRQTAEPIVVAEAGSRQSSRGLGRRHGLGCRGKPQASAQESGHGRRLARGESDGVHLWTRVIQTQVGQADGSRDQRFHGEELAQ